MHLQQAWFQLYLEHHVAMSCMFLAVPQQQVGHLPEGQLPPQLSARARARTIMTRKKTFISTNNNYKSYTIWGIKIMVANYFSFLSSSSPRAQFFYTHLVFSLLLATDFNTTRPSNRNSALSSFSRDTPVYIINFDPPALMSTANPHIHQDLPLPKYRSTEVTHHGLHTEEQEKQPHGLSGLTNVQDSGAAHTPRSIRISKAARIVGRGNWGKSKIDWSASAMAWTRDRSPSYSMPKSPRFSEDHSSCLHILPGVPVGVYKSRNDISIGFPRSLRKDLWAKQIQTPSPHHYQNKRYLDGSEDEIPCNKILRKNDNYNLMRRSHEKIKGGVIAKSEKRQTCNLREKFKSHYQMYEQSFNRKKSVVNKS